MQVSINEINRLQENENGNFNCRYREKIIVVDHLAPSDRIHGYIIGQVANLKQNGPKLRIWPRRGRTLAAGGWTVIPDPDSLLEDDGGTEEITLKISHPAREKVSIRDKHHGNGICATGDKNEVLLTRSAYIKKCTELIPGVTTIRATLVGPMLAHPEWYSKRRMPYRLYPDFDLTLRRRIFELQEAGGLLDDVRLIFRNSTRYVEKISDVVKE